MFAEFSVGLEASPGAWVSYVEVSENICKTFLRKKIFLCYKKTIGPDPDSANGCIGIQWSQGKRWL